MSTPVWGPLLCALVQVNNFTSPHIHASLLAFEARWKYSPSGEIYGPLFPAHAATLSRWLQPCGGTAFGGILDHAAQNLARRRFWNRRREHDPARDSLVRSRLALHEGQDGLSSDVISRWHDMRLRMLFAVSEQHVSRYTWHVALRLDAKRSTSRHVSPHSPAHLRAPGDSPRALMEIPGTPSP